VGSTGTNQSTVPTCTSATRRDAPTIPPDRTVLGAGPLSHLDELWPRRTDGLRLEASWEPRLEGDAVIDWSATRAIQPPVDRRMMACLTYVSTDGAEGGRRITGRLRRGSSVRRPQPPAEPVRCWADGRRGGGVHGAPAMGVGQ